MKTKKVKWDSKVWRSQNQYFEFCDKYRVYGAEAKALKIKMDKETRIPEPKIVPGTHKGSDDDFGRAKVTD